MTADEINRGLAEFMGWEWCGIHAKCYRPVGSTSLDAHRVRFTDSPVACEEAADKMGVGSFRVWRRWDVYCADADGFEGDGPTRSHAFAAALWAAVQEQEK